MRSILLVTALCLGACGYKGPLYLPQDKPEAAKPRASKPAPPAERTAPTEAPQ